MKPEAPHLRVLHRLYRRGIDYVLIGVLGVNHYAQDAGEAYSTADCDVLLKPELETLVRAVEALAAEEYELSAGGEPLPKPDKTMLARILEHRTNIVGTREGALRVDLVLEAGGMTFAEWKKGRKLFKVGSFKVPCASLEKLLAAKKRAGRPKDKAFLSLYRAARRSK